MSRQIPLLVASLCLAAACVSNTLEIPGEAWHIGDHEEYPLSVLPETVRTLGVGALSSVIAGDGGLHLFKIHERKIAK